MDRMDPIDRITVGALVVNMAAFLLWAVYAAALEAPTP